MSEHRMVMETDDETGEQFPICPSCTDDWPCVYAQRDAAQAQVARLTAALRGIKEAIEWSQSNEAVSHFTVNRPMAEIAHYYGIACEALSAAAAARGGSEMNDLIPTPKGVNPDSKTWPYVLAFAIEMERKLEENAQKDWEYDNDDDNEGHRGGPGWLSGFHPHLCMERIYEEVNELRQANLKVYTFTANPTASEHQNVTDEAADVGNMSMMLACITGNLKPYGAAAAAAARPTAGMGGES